MEEGPGGDGIRRGERLIPSPVSWVKGSGIAALPCRLQLQLRSSPWPRRLPYVMGMAIKEKKSLLRCFKIFDCLGHLAISTDIFDCHNLGWGAATGKSCVEARDAAQHP